MHSQHGAQVSECSGVSDASASPFLHCAAKAHSNFIIKQQQWQLLEVSQLQQCLFRWDTKLYVPEELQLFDIPDDSVPQNILPINISVSKLQE